MATNVYVGANKTYTSVEYIESNGGQWIDTGIYGTQNTKVEISVQTGTVSNIYCVFGTFENSTSSSFCSFVSNGDANQRVGNQVIGRAAGYWQSNTSYVIAQDKNGQTVNSVTTNFPNTPADFTTSNTLYLLNVNQNTNQYFSGKLYYAKIWENGTLIKNFIPVIDENNVACLFDLVNNAFYYNNGSGTFVAGSTTGQAVTVNNVAQLVTKAYVGIAEKYTEVEYLESSGTQWINTGVVATSVTKWVFDYQFISTSNAQIGCGNGTDTTRFLFSQGSPNFSGAIGTNVTTTVPFDTNRHTFILDAPNKIIQIDQTSVGATYTSFNSVYSIAFFCRQNSYGTDFIHSGRLYSSQIYENGTLIRDFIPVIDKNNVACLLDLVENKLYYNAGAGSFTYQPKSGATQVTLPPKARKIIKGYVGVNGVARLFFNGGKKTKPTLLLTLNNSTHYIQPIMTATDNHIILAGGCSSANSNPITTVTAYSNDLVATSATGLPTRSAMGGGVEFNGYGIVAGGKTTWSSDHRIYQCLAYNDNLTYTQLSDLSQNSVSICNAANETHCAFMGGSYYNGESLKVDTYDTNLTKTTLTDMSGARRYASGAANSNYLVACGSTHSSTAATDFYDNTGTKTTSTNPYNKYCWTPMGLSLGDYAVFFGGALYENSSPYADCVAYDKNKVATTFNLARAMYKMAGFSTGDYAVFGNHQEQKVYIYNTNLVAEETLAIDVGNGYCKIGARNSNIGMLKLEWASPLRVFKI